MCGNKTGLEAIKSQNQLLLDASASNKVYQNEKPKSLEI